MLHYITIARDRNNQVDVNVNLSGSTCQLVRLILQENGFNDSRKLVVEMQVYRRNRAFKTKNQAKIFILEWEVRYLSESEGWLTRNIANSLGTSQPYVQLSKG